MFKQYDNDAFYDEMFQRNGQVHKHYAALYDEMNRCSQEELMKRHDLAQQSYIREGITFTVYNDGMGTERTIPFDFVPKIIPQEEWKELEKGLIQRVKALNLFIEDVYSDQAIFKDGIVPRELIVSSPYYVHEASNINIKNNNHVFMAGIDLIRDKDGTNYVLEDNLRNPSGMSYVYQSRQVMRKLFPDFFKHNVVETLFDQFSVMLEALESLAPNAKKNPTIVLLTPGIHNSAYYDHSFLAQQMGIELVEGRDLIVMDRNVYMKTTKGLKQVDVIYRRVDDEFLDPLEFNPESMLGVPGLVDACRGNRVAVANGLGNGVADDKATYHYVPDMIRYYLNEEPLLPNVPTHLLSDREKREEVVKNLDNYVIKNTSASGGYDMLIGPHAEEEQIEEFREKILSNPRQYIAQPVISLSRIPSFTNQLADKQSCAFGGRHVDLRAFVISGKETVIFPGGLTRVALKPGSLVVNSSQGGGTKDTWVLSE